MYTLPLLVLAACTAFLYRSKHPDRQLNQAAVHASRRYRLWLGLLTMALTVTAAYRAPIELGEVVTNAQTRQLELQSEKTERRLMADRHHVTEMIEAFGGVENYMIFLKAQIRTDRQK